MALTIRPKVKIKIDDRVWRKMKRNLTRGADYTAQIGWFGGMHSTGVSLPQVAAWNEEGHYTGWGKYSPARPFIRLGFMPDVRRSPWLNKYLPYIHQIAMGRMTWRKLNLMIGEELVEMMQKHILDWDSPANSDLTAALKGFNDPLIHTGQMYDSVKIKVVRRGV